MSVKAYFTSSCYFHLTARPWDPWPWDIQRPSHVDVLHGDKIITMPEKIVQFIVKSPNKVIYWFRWNSSVFSSVWCCHGVPCGPGTWCFLLENCVLLGLHAVSSGNSNVLGQAVILIFKGQGLDPGRWDWLVVPKQNYHYLLCNDPEECSSNLLCGRSLWSTFPICLKSWHAGN